MSGLLIIPIFLVYALITFYILKLIFKIFKKNVSIFILLPIVILLPFWDLFLQKGIKTYYELFLLDPIVYEQPVRDEDGKIESFDFSERQIGFNEKDLKDLKTYSYFFKSISDFVELNIQDSKKENNIKLVRIDMKTGLFKNITEKKSRYIMKKSTNYKYIFFGLAKVSKTIIYDRLKNKKIMESRNLRFTDKYFMFRRNYLLLLRGGSQSDMFKVTRSNKNNGLYELLDIELKHKRKSK